MRINVYAEEIGGPADVEVVTKTVVPDGESEPVTFYGIRHYLASAPELHSGPDDDDRSAITYWVRWTKAAGNDFSALESLFTELFLHNAQAETTERIAALTRPKETSA